MSYEQLAAAGHLLETTGSQSRSSSRRGRWSDVQSPAATWVHGGRGMGRGKPGAGNRWEAVRKTQLRHVLRVEGRQEDMLRRLTVVVWGRGLAQPCMEAVAS